MDDRTGGRVFSENCNEIEREDLFLMFLYEFGLVVISTFEKMPSLPFNVTELLPDERGDFGRALDKYVTLDRAQG